jgi:hypothetical protein
MATALTCSAANDLLARNDTMFGPWIHEAVRETDIWNLDFIKTAPFPEGSGYTHRSIMIEGMTTASAEDDWTAVTASAGGVINPLSAPTITDLTWGQNYTNWAPSYKSYKTPCISLDDLRFDTDVATQLTATVNQLSQLTAEWNGNRARYESARLMPQISCRPGYGPNGIAGVTDTTVMVNKSGVVHPTAKLHQTHLDDAYEWLLTQGAGQASSRANIEDGMPVLTLVTSRQTSDNIINSSGIQDNFRYGNPGELLKPLGVRRVFRGYAHVTDVELPRFDIVAGQLVRRLKWSMTSADSGSARTINSAWNTAAIELNYILPKDAYIKRVINPFEREIAGASFMDRPEYYNAQFYWHNQRDNSTNIFGKIGRWVGLSANASEPVYPKRGLTILAKRCAYDQTFTSCTCAA